VPASAEAQQQADEPRPKPTKETSARPRGKQKGAAGVARTQQLPITATHEHRPSTCACCGRALPRERAQRYTAFGAVGVELGAALRLTHTWHVYFETPASAAM
jgi:hypothetical protein